MVLDEAQRLEKQEKLHRWGDFRVRRLDVMDQYLLNKRRCLSVRSLLVLVAVQ